MTRRPIVIEAGTLTIDESGIAISGWTVNDFGMPNRRHAVIIAVRDYVVAKLTEKGVPPLESETPISTTTERSAELEARDLIQRCRGEA